MRHTAALALASEASPDEPTARDLGRHYDELCQAAADPHRPVAVAVLAIFQRMHDPWFDRLRETARQGESHARALATIALAGVVYDIGQPVLSDEEVLPGLLTAFGDAASEIRREAEPFLRGLGEKAIPGVILLFQEAPVDVQTDAYLLLHALAPEGGVYLAQAIAQAKPELRPPLAVLVTLSTAPQPPGEDLLPWLREALLSPLKPVRADAADILARHRSDGVEILRFVLTHPAAPVEVVTCLAALRDPASRASAHDLDEIHADLRRSWAGWQKDERSRFLKGTGQLGPDGQGSLRLLVSLLLHGDHDEKSWAVGALKDLGPYARSALPDLIEALKIDDLHAPWAFGNLCLAAGPEVIPEVLRLCAEKGYTDLARIYSAFLPMGMAIVPFLLQCADGEDAQQARGAVFALGGLVSDQRRKTAGPPDEAWQEAILSMQACLLRALSRDDALLRRDARQALIEMLGAVGDEALPSLRGLLQHERDQVRASACSAIKFFGPRGASAAPELIARLADPSEMVRRCAEAAIGQLGPDAAKALTTALREGDTTTRRSAAFALTYWPTIPENLATTLVGLAATDEDEDVRWHAHGGLIRLGAGNADPAEALLQQLSSDSEDADRRALALNALGARLPRPAGIEELLRTTLRQEGPTILRAIAARCLCAFPREGRYVLALSLSHYRADRRDHARYADVSEDTRATLAAALGDAHDDVRLWSAYALWTHAEAAAPYATQMLQACDGARGWTGRLLLRGLGETRNSDPKVIERLVAELANEDVTMGREAAAALRTLRPPAETSLVWIRQASRSPDKETRLTAVYALGEFQDLPAERLELLEHALRQDVEDDVRMCVPGAISQTLADQPHALALLFDRARNDPSGRVRRAAVRAVPEMRGEDRVAFLIEVSDGSD